jgi:hypothetical protein
MRHAGAMSQLPGPVRAALGLVVTTIDNARTLPAKIIELPVLAVSTALQASLRAQQRYAELEMRGDELLGRLRAAPEEAPEWATFDEPPSANGRAVPSAVAPSAPPAPPRSQAPRPAPASAPVEHASAKKTPAKTTGKPAGSTAAGQNSTPER